jgi:hypothetical protein
VLELGTWIGIISGKRGIGGGILGRIERRKRICYHRRGKAAGGGGDMTWQGNFVCETQFAYTICISVMLQTRAEQKDKKDTARTIVIDCER